MGFECTGNKALFIKEKHNASQKRGNLTNILLSKTLNYNF